MDLERPNRHLVSRAKGLGPDDPDIDSGRSAEIVSLFPEAHGIRSRGRCALLA